MSYNKGGQSPVNNKKSLTYLKNNRDNQQIAYALHNVNYGKQVP